jgi:hypothetical protein
MMYNSVIYFPFAEHPLVDVDQFKGGAYDLIIFEEVHE